MNDVFLPPFSVVPIHSRSLAQQDSWGVGKMLVPLLWSKTKGAGSVVFVVDTEDDTNHPAVKDNVIPEYCARFTDEPDSVKSEGGHGLHVAHTVKQVAPEVAIGLVKVLGNHGSGSSIAVANGIKFCVDVKLRSTHKVRIINLSLGSNAKSPAITEAIEYAEQNGVHVFCAAGNDGRDVDFPGALPQVTAVGAVDSDLNPANFTSPGKEVDVCAPGVQIAAAWKGGYAYLSGTSMATPHVAGFAALLLSKLDLSPEEFWGLLVLNATDVHDTGFDNQTGYGIPIASEYLEDLDKAPVEEPEQPVKSNWIAWVAVGVVFLLIALFLGYSALRH